MTNNHQGPAAFGNEPPIYDRIAPLDLLGLARIVWQGKWLIALCIIGALTLAGYYAFHMTSPRYGATATLLIDPQGSDTARFADDPATLNTVMTTFTAHDTLAQVIAAHDLLNDPEFNRYLRPVSPLSPSAIRTRLRHVLAGTMPQAPSETAVLEKTITNLRDAISVTRAEDTYLLAVTARSGTPEKATMLANALVEVFVTNRDNQRRQSLQNTQSWLTAQIATLRADRAAQDNAINALIATGQVQDQVALDRLARDVLAAEGELAAAQTRLIALRSATPPQNASQSAIAAAQNAVRDLTRQDDRLRGQLAQQSAGLAQLQHLQREAETTRALYQDMLARLQQTRMQREQMRGASPAISPATTATYLGPRKLWIIEAAALLGALLGLGLIGLRRAFYQGVAGREGLEQATGLPVLAQTPRRMLRQTRRLRRDLVAGASGPLAPSLRAIQSRLMLAHGGHIPKVILCTSSLSGEGADTHAVAIATLLGRLGKGVLLIDASGAKGHPHGPGLADVLQNQASLSDAVAVDTKTGVYRLAVKGRHAADDPALSDGFAAGLAGIAAHYDHVVIAAPPVLLDPTTALWAQQAEAVLYAVRWHKTPLPLVAKGLAELAGADAPATGAILTGVPPRALGSIHAAGTGRRPQLTPA